MIDGGAGVRLLHDCTAVTLDVALNMHTAKTVKVGAAMHFWLRMQHLEWPPVPSGALLHSLDERRHQRWLPRRSRNCRPRQGCHMQRTRWGNIPTLPRASGLPQTTDRTAAARRVGRSGGLDSGGLSSGGLEVGMGIEPISRPPGPTSARECPNALPSGCVVEG